MRFIVATAPGTIELNYMWLPSFIGMDSNFKRYIEEKLSPELVGKELSDETLDWANERVMDLICERYKFEGFRDYLDSIKFVGQ